MRCDVNGLDQARQELEEYLTNERIRHGDVTADHKNGVLVVRPLAGNPLPPGLGLPDDKWKGFRVEVRQLGSPGPGQSAS
jgi:hypothetical protein